MLGKFHVSLSNRLLHLATTKLAIVLYFGYTVNTFWLGSGRLPVKLNYNECQQHITISFSKHEAQFSGKQPYAMFSHTSFSSQRAEFSCCLGRKKKKTVSGSPLIRKKSWIFLIVRQRSVWNGTWRKVIPFPGPGHRWQQGCGASVWTGAGGIDFHGQAHISKLLQTPPNPAGDIKPASLRGAFRLKQGLFEDIEIYFRENFRILIKNAQRRTGLGRGTVGIQSSSFGKDFISHNEYGCC